MSSVSESQKETYSNKNCLNQNMQENYPPVEWLTHKNLPNALEKGSFLKKRYFDSGSERTDNI